MKHGHKVYPTNKLKLTDAQMKLTYDAVYAQYAQTCDNLKDTLLTAKIEHKLERLETLMNLFYLEK